MTVESTGSVKWFSVEKGYGFIIPQAGGPDVFVHKKHLTAAKIDRPLREKESVKYTSKQGHKGICVVSISLIT